MTDWRDKIEDKHSEKIKIEGYFYVKNMPPYGYSESDSAELWGLCFKSNEFEAVIMTSQLGANTLVAKEALERLARKLNE